MASGEAQSKHKHDQRDGYQEAGDEERVDLGPLPAAEAPIPRGQCQPEDHDDVSDALDEDRAHRARRRGTVGALQQVRPIQVAELGRHQTVDEPREKQDLGGRGEADGRASATQDERPPEPAQRKGQVVHQQGDDQKPKVGVDDL